VTDPGRTVSPRLSPLFVFAAIGIVLVLVGVVAVPVLLLERADDWRAYGEAAGSLRSGGPLYPWTTYPDIRSFGQHAYLYPPPLAAIWSWGLTPETFATLKVAALAASTSLLVRSLGGSWVIAAAVSLGAVTSGPAVHDLMLGNVMMVIAAAVTVSLASPGWLGSGALGAACAIALKPAIGPYLLWLLIRRRGTFARALVAGLVTTAVFAILLGPGRYVEYLQALPKTAVLAAPFTGNLGLAAISPIAVLVGMAIAYAWTVFAAIRLDDRSAAVVALAMTQLAQPTIGLNYAVLLIPAVILLWTVERRAAVAMAVSLPIIVLVSPVAAAVILAGTGTIVSLAEARGGPRAASRDLAVR
jgi:glycosyl transferase family 87